MAREILSVPEEHLAEVITVIRTGLQHAKGISTTATDQLYKWCREEEEYLNALRRRRAATVPEGSQKK